MTATPLAPTMPNLTSRGLKTLFLRYARSLLSGPLRPVSVMGLNVERILTEGNILKEGGKINEKTLLSRTASFQNVTMLTQL